jgi:hypothetical protein
VHRIGLLFVLVALVASVAACDTVGDVVNGVVSSPAPIAQSYAEDLARLSSGMSVAPVAVVSSRLSTYGAEHPGGTLAARDLPVWAVILSGAFPYASCLIVVFPSPGATFRPCPSPAARERVLLNGRTGLVIEVIPGG